jgi:hypothetical protein
MSGARATLLPDVALTPWSRTEHEQQTSVIERNTDEDEDDTSGREVVSTRRKREPVRSACANCRKRKTKCSGTWPVCQYCFKSDSQCSWDTTDGLTWTADLKAKVEEAEVRVNDLHVLVEAMRFGTDESSTMLLAQLRIGVDVGELVQSIRSGSSMAASKGV